jgi:hypothetical protein
VSPSFITFVIVFGGFPLLSFAMRWFFKGIEKINKFSKKTITILLYAISSTLFLGLTVVHYLKKYNLIDK